MKIQLLTFFLATTTSLVLAQPTITSSVFGTVGDAINFQEVSTAGLTPGAAGANVTWDFSDITTLPNYYGYELINLADAPENDQFPGANLAADNGVDAFGFIKLTSSEYTNYGVFAGGVITYYDDPEELFVFPMSFGTTNTDNLHSTFFSGIEFERSGTTVSEADAYGTLILPTGSFENVLRVKVAQDYTDDATLLPSPIIYDFTLYYWFKEGVLGPLFQYFELNVGGAFPSETSSAAVNENLAVGIDDVTAQSKVVISPNPAVDNINIEFGNEIYNTQLIVYNQLGQVVISDFVTTTNKIATIDINSLVPGIYQVEALDGNNRFSAKFIKQ